MTGRSQGGRRSPGDRRPTAGLASESRYLKRSPSLGGDQVEGRQAVAELLRAKRRRVKEIWIEDGVERQGLVNDIAEMALVGRVPFISVGRSKFSSKVRSEVSQGIIAFTTVIRSHSIEELVKAKPLPLIIVVDHVTDPHNLGAVLRSAEVAGATGVVIAERRATQLTPIVCKAASGAVEYLSFALVPGIAGALGELSRLGVWSVGLEPDAKAFISEISVLTSPLALVLGSEGSGLSKLVRERCDLLAAIPQFGKIASLNVSAAASIACYEVARQRSQVS